MKSIENRVRALESWKDNRQACNADRRYYDYTLGSGPPLTEAELNLVSTVLKDILPIGLTTSQK